MSESKDFEMIKMLIQTRLTREICAQQQKINEYNQKANVLRQPIINAITQSFREKPDSFIQHPIIGKKLNPALIVIQNGYPLPPPTETMFVVCFIYNQHPMVVGESTINMTINATIPIPSKFLKDLKKYPQIVYQNIDIISLSTEKAAEIVLSGGDVLDRIEKAMAGVLPKIDIPKI